MTIVKRVPVLDVQTVWLDECDHSRDIAITKINPNKVPCFTAETLLISDQDDVPVREVRRGDRVLTPEIGFDVVADVICLPFSTCQHSVVQKYVPRSVGNHLELSVSAGATVYERSDDFEGSLDVVSKELEIMYECCANRTPNFQFYCIVLQRSNKLFANGAIVSCLIESGFFELQSSGVGQNMVA